MLEGLNETSDKAVKIGQKYIDTSKRYIELKIFQQLAISISLVGKVMAVGSFVFIAFLFFSISGAILLGDWLDNTALGYLIVGSIALLIAFLTYGLRKRINALVLSKLSKNF
ncbi:hypothetical protein [Winogradskyella sp. A3E31]|uniref:hypothetical protein n=1 Tax=Winogradskyella sp. A3E31 TaxID=3349637 RepID=UPI00398AF017